MVLSAYFQPSEDAAIIDAQLAWWMDELEDWTHEQVVAGLRQWNRENPRRRPTPGDISGWLKAERGRQAAARKIREARQEPEAPVNRPTADRAAEIMAEVGFSGLRRFPKAGEGGQ